MTTKTSEALPQFPAGTLTSQALRDHVLEHVLANFPLFNPPGIENPVEHLRDLLDSLETMSKTIAMAAVANRQHLSPLPVYAGTISVDPAEDASDTAHQLRFRLVEQIGDAEPYIDKVFTLDEAVKEYGQDFVETHWGNLGEHCPRCVPTQGDRNVWFTVVRYPSDDMGLSNHAAATQRGMR